MYHICDIGCGHVLGRVKRRADCQSFPAVYPSIEKENRSAERNTGSTDGPEDYGESMEKHGAVESCFFRNPDCYKKNAKCTQKKKLIHKVIKFSS